MKRLSFSDYYASKSSLLTASESVPRIRSDYKLTKYCRFPVYESLDGTVRTYVTFKPKDKINVLWEPVDENDAYPVAKRMVLISEGGKEVFPCWHNKKIHQWIENNTSEI